MKGRSVNNRTNSTMLVPITLFVIAIFYSPSVSGQIPPPKTATPPIKVISGAQGGFPNVQPKAVNGITLTLRQTASELKKLPATPPKPMPLAVALKRRANLLTQLEKRRGAKTPFVIGSTEKAIVKAVVEFWLAPCKDPNQPCWGILVDGWPTVEIESGNVQINGKIGVMLWPYKTETSVMTMEESGSQLVDWCLQLKIMIGKFPGVKKVDLVLDWNWWAPPVGAEQSDR